MRRDDLPAAYRRELDRQRRRVVRAVGSAFDGLVDAGVDPSEAMAEATTVLVRHLRAAQTTDQREAA